METMQTVDECTDSGRLSRRRFVQGALLLGGGVMLDALCPLPAAAGGPFKMPTPAQQKQVGQEATQKVLAKYRSVNDGRTRFFKNLGSRLIQAIPSSERQQWDFQFYVLDSDEINAFAVPGGHVFLFTGLFKRLDTEDALAAVTAHELAHVRKQHWAKAAVKEQERMALFSIGVALLKGSREAATVAQLADTAIGLKYSRGDEDEADSAGLSNMVAAGYNPKGMLDLLTTLQKIAGNGGSLVGDFLSDHPLTGERISRTQQRIASLQGSHTFPPMKPLRYDSLT